MHIIALLALVAGMVLVGQLSYTHSEATRSVPGLLTSPELHRQCGLGLIKFLSPQS
jgi:hypothetical protein